MSNSAQSSPGDPGATAFIAGNRPPTTGAIAFPTRIDATANRTSSGNHNHARLAVRRAIQCDIRIANNLDVPDIEVSERFPNAFAQFPATRTCQTDFRGQDIFAAELGRFASFVDRLAHSRGSSGNTHSQRVRWASQSLANYSFLGIHHDGVGLSPTTVDTNHRVGACKRLAGERSADRRSLLTVGLGPTSNSLIEPSLTILGNADL